MYCKYCGSKLENGATICNNCGKPIRVENTQEVEIHKIDIEKVKKIVKDAGESAYAIGWISVITAIGVYIWSIFDKNFLLFKIPIPDLSGTFLMIVFSSMFVILGKRIAQMNDKNIPLYLKILSILSLINIILRISTGQRIGILVLLLMFYLVYASIVIRKAMRMEGFTAMLTTPKYKLDKKGWIIFALATLLILFITLGIDSIIQEGKNYSNTEIVKEIVKEIESKVELPYQLNEETILTEIKPEEDAIHFYYTLSRLDIRTFSYDYLKNYLTFSVCDDDNTRILLNKGINFKYSYTVEGTNQNYFVTVTKLDCLKQ